MRRVLEATTLALCTLLLACAGEGPSGGAGMAAVDESVSFASVQPLLNQACNCHQSEPFLMAPFSLKPIDAYENLVDKPSSQLPSMALVKPGVLNESYLWHKVSGTQLEVGGSGMIMPYTIPLTDDERMIIARWIVAGVPR
jgi:hypothetical protein